MRKKKDVLNAASVDPDFTSEEDAEDPMVFMQLDIKNAFGSLCVRLIEPLLLLYLNLQK